MANINGTNLAAPVVPFTTDDTYPTHYAMYGKGGHRSVQTITNRNAIPVSLREVGMTVYVIAENKTYKLTGDINLNTGWVDTIITVGSDTQVIFNDGGVLAGNSAFTYDKSTKRLRVVSYLDFRQDNLYLGNFAGNSNPNNSQNTQNIGLGYRALQNLTNNALNVAIGSFALGGSTNARGTVAIGKGALGNSNAQFSVAIGYEAGSSRPILDSYKLDIENSSRIDSLIEGDFSQRWVRFNGAQLKRVVNITAPSSALTTGTVTSYLNGVITDSSKNFTVNAYAGKLLIITGGLGVGKVTKINSNTATTITQTTSIVCDSTSTYKIIDTTNILNKNFNSEYFVDLTTEDHFIYLNDIPNYSQEINITIINNPNNKNLWIAGETTNGFLILPYNVIYKSYNTPLKTYTFKSYRKDSFNKGYIESTQDLKQLKPISTTTKDIQIDLNSEIYKLDVATATTITLNINSTYVPILTNNALTIELHINMTIASTITWPVNVSWIGGSAPTFNAIAKYCVVLRTMDAGTTWIANLAYTY